MPPPRLRWPRVGPRRASGESAARRLPAASERGGRSGGGHPAPTRGSGACPCPSSAEARAPHFGVLLACLGRGWAAAGACPSPIPEGSAAEGPLRSPLEVLVLPDDPGEPPGQLESGEPWRQGVSGCAQQTQPGRPGSAGTGPGPPRAWIHSGGGGGGGVTGPAPSACTLVRAQGHGGPGDGGGQGGARGTWSGLSPRGGASRAGVGGGAVWSTSPRGPWKTPQTTPSYLAKAHFFSKFEDLLNNGEEEDPMEEGAPGRPAARRSVQGPGPAGGGGAPACSRHRPRRHLTLSPPPPTSLLPQKRTSETARVHNSAYTYII